MKRLSYLVLCALALVSFSNCKSKTTSPGHAAKQSAESLKSGNYDEFVEFILFDQSVPQEAVKQEKTVYSKVLKEQAHPAIQEKGGIKEVAVASENVASDGKNAEVVVTHTYNNGDTENVSYDMVLVDNVWKVKLGDDKTVWKTHAVDGSKVAFKLKESDYKDVFKENVDGERDFVKEIHTDNKDVVKIKEDGEKEVIKVKDKGDEEVIKIKEGGEKEVIKVEK